MDLFQAAATTRRHCRTSRPRPAARRRPCCTTSAASPPSSPPSSNPQPPTLAVLVKAAAELSSGRRAGARHPELHRPRRRAPRRRRRAPGHPPGDRADARGRATGRRRHAADRTTWPAYRRPARAAIWRSSPSTACSASAGTPENAPTTTSEDSATSPCGDSSAAPEHRHDSPAATGRSPLPVRRTDLNGRSSRWPICCTGSAGSPTSAGAWSPRSGRCVLVVLGVGALTLGGKTANTFSIPGTESQRALDALKTGVAGGQWRVRHGRGEGARRQDAAPTRP